MGLALITGCATLEFNDRYLLNPDLPVIKSDYPGNLYKYGKFQTQYTSVGSNSLGKYLRWKLISGSDDPESNATYVNHVIKHDQLTIDDQPFLMWLGHATVLLRIGDRSIIIDPILTSPRLFHGSRLNEIPISAEKIDVDIILASHGHRDHLDAETVRSLGGDSKTALVPLKMGSMINDWDADISVQEASWYQQFSTDSEINIYLLPALHWHRRSLFDTNSVLWGSYLVEYQGTSIYFAGDSGYSSHFKEIGELFNDIDYAVLPIGAYEPAEVVGNSHMTPEEAVFAFKDLGADIMIPIHYGTYKLSAEPLSEPLERLLNQIELGKMAEHSVDVLKIGEIL